MNVASLYGGKLRKLVGLFWTLLVARTFSKNAAASVQEGRVFRHSGRIEIAQALGISRPSVQLWSDRFLALRLEGLRKDAPRPGSYSEPSQATLHAIPPNATHWSVRSMAKAQGISRMAMQRIWDRYGLKPHLAKTFQDQQRQHLVEKLYDVWLYFNPPDRALVLCVDEKR